MATGSCVAANDRASWTQETQAAQADSSMWHDDAVVKLPRQAESRALPGFLICGVTGELARTLEVEIVMSAELYVCLYILEEMTLTWILKGNREE